MAVRGGVGRQWHPPPFAAVSFAAPRRRIYRFGPIKIAFVNIFAGPRQNARNSGSLRNSTTRPEPWFSTTAHVVPLRSRAVLSGQVNPESTRESTGSVKVTAFAPLFDGRQNVSPSMNTGIRFLSYPSVNQWVVSSVARKIAPGIHSGRSRAGAVVEINAGSFPAAVVSAFAPLSGATLAMLESSTSLFAARSPAPP